jgi:molybdate transport system ATP-binding protein
VVPVDGLTAAVRLRLGALDLDVDLEAPAGAVVAVVGPNGAGKTTLLRALAGLVPLAAGRVAVDGEVLDDRAAGVWVPPERRPVGVVFQDSLLFPHLSALDNVAFGLRCRGRRRREARAAALGWLDRFGLGAVAGLRPRALSGGQAQRVALARALAVEPRLLLLDEPLAAADPAARPELRREVRRHLAAFPGARLLVTHDPVEALVLADRLVVLEGGRVVQAGTPGEVSRRPRSTFAARLVGRNLFRGTAGAGGREVVLPGGALLVPAEPAAGEVFAAVAPSAVALHAAPPAGSPRNVWPGTVADLDVEGDRVRVAVDGPVPLVAEVTAAAVADLGLAPGRRVWAAVKATEVEVYEA